VKRITRRLVLLGPAGVIVAGGVGLWAAFDRIEDSRQGALGTDSALIGRQVPGFALPGQGADRGFTAADMKAAHRPVLLNFFASWCSPCAAEAPVLMGLRQAGVPIFGIAFKDKPAATDAFLHQHGDPYTRIDRDETGGLDDAFKLAGVPETYLIDKAGIVRWRWVGELRQDVVDRTLGPLLTRLG
jgi:cytochrome c biogenesis protein CcmG/thiol:disulfide interchange protein DsbE